MAEPHPSDAAVIRPARPISLTGPSGVASAGGVGDLPSSFGSTSFGALPLDPPATGLAGAATAPGERSVFDVCHVGVVLRALLFVHAAVAVGALFGAREPYDWVVLLALGASVALPAVLLWLVSVCLLQRALARLRPGGQWAAVVGLGAVAGGFGWSLQALFGLGPGMGGSTGLSGLQTLAPVVAGAVLSAAFFYWLTLRARARLPADTTARLAELQSRIRPHFLFNTLNTAITLARLDPARTEGLLEDLAELFRVALSDGSASVSLADEVALAQRYLAIEQIRFGERLQITWALDPAAGAARVPPLLLQPLVENAVRHGVEPATAGGTVRIRTRVQRGHAVITITNSVPAVPSRPGNGMALHNVRERLSLMHDVAAQFEVQQARGVHRVQIVVPL